MDIYKHIDIQINLCLIIAKTNEAEFLKANPLLRGAFCIPLLRGAFLFGKKLFWHTIQAKYQEKVSLW